MARGKRAERLRIFLWSSLNVILVVGPLAALLLMVFFRVVQLNRFRQIYIVRRYLNKSASKDHIGTHTCLKLTDPLKG